MDMTENGEPNVDIYTATSREEAEAFIERWNALELRLAKSWGGYPGMAVIAEPNGSSEPELLEGDNEHAAGVWLAS